MHPTPTLESVRQCATENPTAAARDFLRLIDEKTRHDIDPQEAEKVIRLGFEIARKIAPTGGPAQGFFQALAGAAERHPRKPAELLEQVIDVGLGFVHDVAWVNPMAAHSIHVTTFEHAKRLGYREMQSTNNLVASHKRNIAPDLTPPHRRFAYLTADSAPLLTQEKKDRKEAEGILYAAGLSEGTTSTGTATAGTTSTPLPSATQPSVQPSPSSKQALPSPV